MHDKILFKANPLVHFEETHQHISPQKPNTSLLEMDLKGRKKKDKRNAAVTENSLESSLNGYHAMFSPEGLQYHTVCRYVICIWRMNPTGHLTRATMRVAFVVFSQIFVISNFNLSNYFVYDQPNKRHS